MATLELVLLLGTVVLVSSIIDQVLPKVSPPLIQIGLGLLVAFLASSPINVTLDPELFLMLFIAPLLYHDARESDKIGLWSNRGKIISLAIGLVVAITLMVGFTMKLLIPSLPLAAAFALGAALGPTDAVAVTSIRAAAKLNKQESGLLSGECLINDASGVVSFQFAVAAAVTGQFSITEAVSSFLISFIGGILIGLLLAWIAHIMQARFRELGLDSVTFHVLFDIMQPFLMFLIAEAAGVSGILAVVSGGILLSILEQNVIGPSSAKLGIVSNSVWRVLAFTLNGMVFVMLGMQLPSAMQELISSPYISNMMLIEFVLIITAVLVLTRFIWVYIMEKRRARSRIKKGKVPEPGSRSTLRTALIETLGGPKGAITLSIAFSIPMVTGAGAPFPQRSLLIFVACGVILCTLLLANFLLPILAPAHDSRSKEDDENELALIKIEILNTVANRLMSETDEKDNRAARSVIRSYHERIRRIRDKTEVDAEETIALRIKVLEQEQQCLLDMLDDDEFNRDDVIYSLVRISRAKVLIEHKVSYLWALIEAIRHFSISMEYLKGRTAFVMRSIAGKPTKQLDPNVKLEYELAAIKYLEGLAKDCDKNYTAEKKARAAALAHKPSTQSMQDAQDVNAINAADAGKAIDERTDMVGTEEDEPQRPLEDYRSVTLKGEDDYSPSIVIPKRVVMEQLLLHRVDQSNAHNMQMNATAIARTNQRRSELERKAYNMELDAIDDLQESGRLSRADAKKMRDNVYTMLVDLER